MITLALWLAVWCVSVGLLMWFGAGAIGEAPPEIVARYGRYVPWQGVSRIALIGLLAWCLIWTWTVIAAIGQLLRALVGSDVITIGGDLSAAKRIGPFGGRRSFAVQSVRAVSVRRKDGALTIALDDGSVAELTRSGTREERMQLRDLIRQRFYLATEPSHALTPYFEQTTAPDGTRIVTLSAGTRRRFVGCTAGITAIWLAATGWHILHDGQFSLGDPMLLVAVLLVAALVAVARAEQSWRVKKGWFAYVRALGPYRRRSEYDAAAFRIEERKDSDGDLWFTLYVEQDRRKESLHSAMNDPEDVAALGRFLAHESGFPLDGLRDE